MTEQATPELPTPPAASKHGLQPSGRELLKRLAETRFARIVVSVVALALAGLSGAFFDEIYYYFRSEPTFRPYVAVVASKEAIDFPIPTEFLRGFQDGAPEGRTYIEDRDKRQIDIRILEDLGSTDEAARIANELVNDENCILVVGLGLALTEQLPPCGVPSESRIERQQLAWMPFGSPAKTTGLLRKRSWSSGTTAPMMLSH